MSGLARRPRGWLEANHGRVRCGWGLVCHSHGPFASQRRDGLLTGGAICRAAVLLDLLLCCTGLPSLDGRRTRGQDARGLV